MPSSGYLISLASPCYSPLGIFPSRKFGLRLSFWQMIRHANMGLGFPPSKVTWEPDQSVGPLESPNAPCQKYFWMSVTLLSASLPSWATPFVLLSGSWFLASCLAHQHRMSSASCYVAGGTLGHAAVWSYPRTDTKTKNITAQRSGRK